MQNIEGLRKWIASLVFMAMVFTLIILGHDFSECMKYLVIGYGGAAGLNILDKAINKGKNGPG